MSGDLQPEDVVRAAKKGQVEPFYLFYGPGDFRMERVLASLKTLLVPEAARDFNLEVIYGDDKIEDQPIEPEQIINKGERRRRGGGQNKDQSRGQSVGHTAGQELPVHFPYLR